MISTPIADSSEPSGPMQNGTTYMVRPRMAPRNRPPSPPSGLSPLVPAPPLVSPRPWSPFRPVKISRISAGAFQWLVGPASASRREQMKVRSSTRATSVGSDAA